jgi:hypothetical protein
VPLEQRLVKNASSHRTVVAESNILHYTDKKCVLIFLLPINQKLFMLLL